jgi:HNH endonuclease
MRTPRSGPPDLAGRRRPDRRRYTDEEILTQLVACAERLGRSPTMREFRAEQGAHAHPQTVSERFGTWNGAKRRAGLAPRRFATREELLALLRELGRELGRPPTGRDLETRRGAVPRGRCSGTSSARSRPRCARQASICPRVKSGWTARSSKECGLLATWAGSPG